MTEEFGEIIKNDFFHLFTGRKIGEGSSRKVFEHNHDDSLVIKIENGAKSFCNVKEYEIWQQVQYADIAKWFAPVIDISQCGSILLMKKVEPVKLMDMPEKIPNFFTDLKLGNWGKYDDRIVCCDYGITLLKYSNNATQKAQWWE